MNFSTTLLKVHKSMIGMDILPIILMVFIIIYISIIISILFYRIIKYVRNKRIKREKDFYNSCLDILNLNYIIINDKKSGLPIYIQHCSEKKIEPELISGFLQSIQSFGIELIKGKDPSKTISFEYKDSIILMSEYGNLRLILIMKNNPSRFFVKSIEKLTEDIYKNYGNLIDTFNGNIQPFKGIEDLIIQHLNIHSLYPFISSKVKLKKKEKDIIKKALRELKLNQKEPEMGNRVKERLKDLLKKFDNEDDDFFPYPYIFKPPSPPGDLSRAGEPQAKQPITEKLLESEPYCKHCGAELPKGQLICHVCGNKV